MALLRTPPPSSCEASPTTCRPRTRLRKRKLALNVGIGQWRKQTRHTALLASLPPAAALPYRPPTRNTLVELPLVVILAATVAVLNATTQLVDALLPKLVTKPTHLSPQLPRPTMAALAVTSLTPRTTTRQLTVGHTQSFGKLRRLPSRLIALIPLVPVYLRSKTPSTAYATTA